MAKSVEEQRKIAQAKAARLEDPDFSPEYEKQLEKLSDEFVAWLDKEDKKNAKSGK